MKYLKVDYVVGEIVDTIGLMQLNNELVPNLDHAAIEKLADEFIFEWQEVGDYEANFEETLRQFLTYEFAKF